MTPLGFKKLQDEHNHLTKNERPKTVKVVTWAASLGDRSENADYQYGKKRLREIDRRLRFLSKRIDIALIVDPEISRSEKIQFGATVLLESEDNIKKTYSIVGADEIDTPKGLISWLSPIGKALIGKEEGDEVTVHSPKGTMEYMILEVKYIKIELEEFSP
ncbi:MAG: transcription elongation factor GreB [Bacteriovoracaceae bacterium]|nr:transcription elongation factor GreB [Bacteriovoracaceae bacterium]